MAELMTVASPEKGTTRLVTLQSLRLAPGEQINLETGGQEHVIDILCGSCDIRVQMPNERPIHYRNIGQRPDIFSGVPEFVYAPRRSRYSVLCTRGPVEAAIATALTEQQAAPAYVRQDQVRALVSGVSDWKRDVYIGCGGDGPAKMLMVGETHSPPGNWSGFPPHRHDRDRPPEEADMEEVYYFKFSPPTGFAIGGTYQDLANREETTKLSFVRDGHVFDVPSGYHFIAPCPGYRLHYLWVLCGPHLRFGAWVADPEYVWLANYGGT